MDAPIVLRLLAALLVGLVVGVERERRKRDPKHWAPAGIRTFALVALLGGVATQVGTPFLLLTGILVLVLVAIPKLDAMRRGAAAAAAQPVDDDDDDGSPEPPGHTLTTDIALVVVFALGAFAQAEPLVAMGAALVVSLLLASRKKVHDAVTRPLSTAELIDALTLGVAAIVVLPLIPNRTVDPWGVVNPFTLAKLAVTMMAVTFGGYVAARSIGPRYGLFVAGFFSGFVSSSATIGAMGSRAKEDEANVPAATAGAAASSVATFIQMAVIVGSVSPALVRAIAVPLAGGGLAAAVFAVLMALRAKKADPKPVERGRAFSVRAAVLFAALVGAVTVGSTLLGRYVGEAGALIGAAVAAFADAHAAGASLGSLFSSDGVSERGAVIGVLAGITTNSVTKIVIAYGAGGGSYAHRVSAGVILAAAATWAAFGATTILG